FDWSSNNFVFNMTAEYRHIKDEVVAAPVEPLEKIPTLDELQKAFDKEPASSTGNKASNSAK
ncbi:hypothetical protein, partial [Oenococcus oeni]|uniref:hypothetical protein n=1 Tax=Oenococcus oeni TaxID=1247 RepID=UPI0015D66EAF